ncbi:MAG: cupin domain-containing protein [Bacteroidota bacterium]
MKLNTEKYIASGIIEQYCLGLATSEEASELEQYCTQYKAVRLELEAVQNAMLGFASQFAKTPPQSTGRKILHRIEELKFDTFRFSANGQLPEFIALSEHSNSDKWKAFVEHITPPAEYDNIHYHEIFRNHARRLAVVWLKEGIEDESHDALKEKFLILEGTCRCQLGEEFIDLGPGTFLDIPLHTVHNLKVTSKEPVKLILSKEKLAA